MNKALKRIHNLENRLLKKHRMKEMNKKFPLKKTTELDVSEKKAIHEKWGELSKYGLVGSGYDNVFAFYKFFHNTVDVNLSPSDFYYNCELALNKRWSLNFLSHKSNLHCFVPEQNRPTTIIYNINDHLYDACDRIITKEEGFKLMKNKNEFVVKQSLFTGGGKGVRRFENPSDDQIKEILDGSDFIAQEILTQHVFFSELNQSSVNTIRMETLFLNNTVTVLSAFIRIGAKGSFVDNITGREGMVVGVDENGKLCSFGLTKDYDKVYESSSGKEFEGLVIPNYQYIKNTVLEFHKQFPLVNLINWDVAIDENGLAKIIEINLNAMNPLYHQIFNGPIFKDRTNEVIDFVIHHSK